MNSTEKNYLQSKKAVTTLLGVVATLAIFTVTAIVAAKEPQATWLAGVATVAILAVAAACGYHVHRQGIIDQNTP